MLVCACETEGEGKHQALVFDENSKFLVENKGKLK
jgi:hypothetical protein